MNKSYYPKLAISNLKKNRQTYLPYMIACITAITMFFILNSLTKNGNLLLSRGGAAMVSVLQFGSMVIGIFSVILLFYTNSFLIKRRKREIGLYNILGMEKKHLAYMMAYETLFTYGICLGLGLILGLLLNKLMFLLLLRILQFDTHMDFQISFSAILNTIVLFAFIFILMLICNLFQIHLAKPVELLSAGKTGEREPKGKLLLTLIGLACLAAGYYLAVTTDIPLSALSIFFIAILLVIGGTYLLFTTGSIVFLKALKRNKNYYYKTEHFISTSSLIYRMKQNATGLASICILSTAVLIILSTTISMYWGMKDILYGRYPKEVSVTLENPSEDTINAFLDVLNTDYASYEVAPKDIINYQYAFLMAHKENHSGSRLKLEDLDLSNSINNFSDYAALYLLTLEDYNTLTGNNCSLAANEALLYRPDHAYTEKTINLNGDVYKIAGDSSDFPGLDNSVNEYIDAYYLVLPDAATILSYDQRFNESPEKMALNRSYQLDVTGETQQIHDFSIAVYDTLNSMDGVWADCREEAKSSFLSIYGALFFIGIFLGALFLGATVLIIYYKQISEGFDDRERFILMEKVGLSKAEIKKTIHSQVLKVFFLPLLMAVIHIAFAFRLMTQLLAMLSMTNIQLFLLCTVSTIIIFAVVYALIYEITAKSYYKIIN